MLGENTATLRLQFEYNIENKMLLPAYHPLENKISEMGE